MCETMQIAVNSVINWFFSIIIIIGCNNIVSDYMAPHWKIVKRGSGMGVRYDDRIAACMIAESVITNEWLTAGQHCVRRH